MGKCHDFCNCDDCGKHKDFKKDSCDFVKDKLCCHWCIPRGQAQNVYVTAGLNVFASGFISVDCTGDSNVVVRFFNGNTPVAGPFGVFEGGCMTFTAANFNRIEVFCPAAPPGAADGEQDDNNCSGKICITPRYQVKCDFDDHDKDCGC
ncbi:S-Ena type endospore appendage [Fredinandcohnia sp. 179-A 10B2 NHS]|uniref:S-Ena type endospore appendage n=1 Tax=Fredinandcohnia sp. 179-A 10B2 NHS TaxID=3235176 RepID=UPI0039A0B67D